MKNSSCVLCVCVVCVVCYQYEWLHISWVSCGVYFLPVINILTWIAARVFRQQMCSLPPRFPVQEVNQVPSESLDTSDPGEPSDQVNQVTK